MAWSRVSVQERELICRLRFEGHRLAEIATEVGRGHATVERVLADAGGLPPRRTGRAASALTLSEREHISRGLAAGRSLRAIAGELGRAASTVSREVAANGGRERYRAWAAERRAVERAARPKTSKLADPANAGLRVWVEAGLALRWSPEQIAGWLRRTFPHNRELWVSHETIYRSIYVHLRGELGRELAACLRSGRAQRKSRARSARDTGAHITDMVPIADRPPEVADRAVPGHWEGDLIVGKDGKSAIGTLVERTTRFVMLLALPNGHSATEVLHALLRQVPTLPAQLRKSLTWDQGSEMARHGEFSTATGMTVYFCDPRSPWQRPTNENTNGLLRQYFPKGTDLSIYTQPALDAVARELNGRPRKALHYKTPSEALTEIVATAA
jgi:transposase, IS30 family